MVNQELDVAGKIYRRNHPIVKYLNSLHYLESSLYALPKSWGDYKPREISQQVVVGLINTLFNKTPKQNDVLLTELNEKLLTEIDSITSVVAENEIIATEQNWEVYRSWVLCEAALNGCVEAKDYLELEAKDTSHNMLWSLDKASIILATMTDWLNKFLIVHTLNEEGKLSPKFSQWSSDKINSLNI